MNSWAHVPLGPTHMQGVGVKQVGHMGEHMGGHLPQHIDGKWWAHGQT
jgi:hypothetical protein